MKINQYQLEKHGGPWLGETRSWIQHNIPYGDSVHWGSTDQLTLSVKNFEQFAAYLTSFIVNEYGTVKPLIKQSNFPYFIYHIT